MTTEIDAEGLAKAAEAIDTLWSEGQDRGPSFTDTEREYQEHCRSTARAAIRAYLAASSTSEAEPVAWRWPEPNTGGFHVVVGSRPLEDLDRWQPLYAQPLPTTASDDQVEAVARAICRSAGRDPDYCPEVSFPVTHGHGDDGGRTRPAPTAMRTERGEPTWTLYTGQARAALAKGG